MQQVLEGPHNAVRTLYDKIALDPRHTDCKVLSEETVTTREYEQWGMLQGEASQVPASPLRDCYVTVTLQSSGAYSRASLAGSYVT